MLLAKLRLVALNCTHASASKTAASKSSSHRASSHRTKTQTSSARGKKGSKNSRTAKKRGQQAIDHDLATAIQEALIREHSLQGEPSGTWDAATQAAMQKYQADQGWQSKTTSNSRALIKLGFGPSKDHLLNPESAMTSSPATGDPKKARPTRIGHRIAFPSSKHSDESTRRTSKHYASKLQAMRGAVVSCDC